MLSIVLLGVSPYEHSETYLEEKVPGRTVLLTLLPFLFSTDSGHVAWPLPEDWPSIVGLACIARAGLASLPFPSGVRVASTAVGLPTDLVLSSLA